MEQILIQKVKRRDSETLRNILKRNNISLDNCRFCNDFLERVEIHHIDGNFLNNDIRNLVVLCSYCHWAIHFKPNQLMKRNIGNQWNKDREFTEEHKKNISLSKKGKTYDEIYFGDNGKIKAENHSIFMKELYNKPEYKEKRSKIFLENWKNSQFKERMGIIFKESWKNDDIRKKNMSEFFKNLWQNPEFREKMKKRKTKNKKLNI